MTPASPFCPWSPLLPFVKKLIETTSESEIGFVVEEDWWAMVNVYQPVLSKIDEIWKIRNLDELLFLDILTNPLISEVTLLIVSIKESIVTPETFDVSLIYNSVEVVWNVPFNLNFVDPGSSSVVEERFAIYSNVAPPKVPDLPWNPWYPV